jgi:hypothetical protein
VNGAAIESAVFPRRDRVAGQFLLSAFTGARNHMSMINDIPTLCDAIPYPDAPRYFVRDWNRARSTITPLRYNANRFQGFGEPLQLLGATPGLVRIYGYSCRSADPEARKLEDWLWTRQKAFPAVCFSTLAPGGEYVFTPAAAVVEISLESLERELERLGAGSITRGAS